jgi:hypothetical protein
VLKGYAPNILLAEATFELPSLFVEDVSELRDRALASSRARLAEEGGRTSSGARGVHRIPPTSRVLPRS